MISLAAKVVKNFKVFYRNEDITPIETKQGVLKKIVNKNISSIVVTNLTDTTGNNGEQTTYHRLLPLQLTYNGLDRVVSTSVGASTICRYTYNFTVYNPNNRSIRIWGDGSISNWTGISVTTGTQRQPNTITNVTTNGSPQLRNSSGTIINSAFTISAKSNFSFQLYYSTVVESTAGKSTYIRENGTMKFHYTYTYGSQTLEGDMFCKIGEEIEKPEITFPTATTGNLQITNTQLMPAVADLHLRFSTKTSSGQVVTYNDFASYNFHETIPANSTYSVKFENLPGLRGILDNYKGQTIYIKMKYSTAGLGNVASPTSYIYYGIEEFEDTYQIDMDTTTTYSIYVSDLAVGG